jgi:hypothetical protein
MKELQDATIEFKVRGETVKYRVLHNLPDFGLDIEDAFYSWSFRTKIITIASFCRYARSKNPDLICKPFTPNKK